MKWNLLFFIPAFTLVFLAASCSKDDSPAAPTLTPVGTWLGTGQYGTTPGNPTYIFSIKLSSTGTVDIIGNNSTGIDNATGTWQLVQDSVKATYTYSGSSAVYALSGKYSSGSNVMTGTIGLSPSTTGTGIFTVTRQ